MMERGFFHIFLVLALAVLLPACGVSVVSAANITTHNATDIAATWATLNGEVTRLGDEICDHGTGPCNYGGVKPLFTAVLQRGMAPLEVQFYDMSTGNPISWQWDFGDGTTSVEQNPKHVYTNPGTYPVTLWVKNSFNSGSLLILECIVVLASPEPVSVVTSSATSVTGTEATLRGSLLDIGLESSVDVFFKYGTDQNFGTYGTYNSVSAGTLSSAGDFSVSVPVLMSKTMHYFQACAKTDADKEICGSILPFASGEGSIDVFFKYGTDPNLLVNTLADAGTLWSDGMFRVLVSGLTPGTRYYFQACGTTGTGEICNGILSFMYEPTSMVVSTNTVTNVTPTGATLNGAVTFLGGEPSVPVFFKYGLDPSLGTFTRADAGTLFSAGVFDADVSVATGSMYYYQACATSSTGDVCGAIFSFVLFQEPCPTIDMSVATAPATSVTDTGATLNGAITDMGGESSVPVFFKYGTDSTLGTFTLANAGTLSSATAFNAPVSGLMTGTRYYFQACGTGSTGDICGAILSFVPEVLVIPEVSVVTAAPTSVTGTGATLNGAVTDIGLESSVGVFFQYGTDPGLGTFTYANAGTLSNAGIFTAPVSGLTPGTLYYFRACATSSTGDVCGAILSFVVFMDPCPVPTDTPTVTPTETVTPTPIPTDMPTTTPTPGDTDTPTPTPTPVPSVSIVTSPATNVTGTDVTLHGDLTDIGLESNVAVFFRYGTDSNLVTFIQEPAGTLLIPGVFDATITGLAPGTYYFQACSTTSVGDVCGSILSFVLGSVTPTDTPTATPTLGGTDTPTPTPTPVPPVSIVTNPATNVTGTDATLHGDLTDIGVESNVSVFFRYGTDSNLVTFTQEPAGTLSIPGVFDATITGLAPGTYHFQACSTTSMGDVCGSILSFVLGSVTPTDTPTATLTPTATPTSTPTPIPTVSIVTNPATNVTAINATLNGELADLAGEPSVNAFFKFGTDPFLVPSTNVTLTSPTLSSVGVFSARISGLVTGTQYYFQACGTGSAGDVCGAILSFIPSVATPTPTPTMSPTATVTVTPTATTTSTMTPTATATITPNITTTSTITSTATATVIPNVTTTSTITPTATATAPPTATPIPTSTLAIGVLTHNATNVNAPSGWATLNGEVTDMGGESSVSTFFKHGTDPGLSASTSVSAAVLFTEDFFDALISISNISPATTYYFQACATDSTASDVCGAIDSFLT